MLIMTQSQAKVQQLGLIFTAIVYKEQERLNADNVLILTTKVFSTKGMNGTRVGW